MEIKTSKIKKCVELSNGFINGNISWVREEIKNNVALALQTAEEIYLMYGLSEFHRFIRLMIK